MCRNTKIALSAAMVFGATCIAPANQTLAEDSYNFEPGGRTANGSSRAIPGSDGKNFSARHTRASQVPLIATS